MNQYYDYTKDNAEDRSAKSICIEVAHVYHNGGIQENKMQGMEITTHVNMTVPSFYRQTIMNDLYLFSIQQLEVNYTSDIMSGYIGLAPYTDLDVLMSNHLQEEEVFLHELKAKNHVEH